MDQWEVAIDSCRPMTGCQGEESKGYSVRPHHRPKCTLHRQTKSVKITAKKEMTKVVNSVKLLYLTTQLSYSRRHFCLRDAAFFVRNYEMSTSSSSSESNSGVCLKNDPPTPVKKFNNWRFSEPKLSSLPLDPETENYVREM